MDMLNNITASALFQAGAPREANLHAKDNAAARKAAEDFESIFIQQFVEQMWSGVETDGPFGGGQGEEVFRSLLNEEYAKNIASQGGIGLADNVYREIIKLQEIGNQ